MLEFKYDTQLLLEGENLDEDAFQDYFTEHFQGDCLLVVGEEDLLKIHFHTNEPWKVLEYCAGQAGAARLVHHATMYWTPKGMACRKKKGTKCNTQDMNCYGCFWFTPS